MSHTRKHFTEELLSRSLLLVTVLVLWLVQVKASSIWLSHFRFGPIEWLWRSATYRRLEPLQTRPLINKSHRHP